MDSNNKNLNSAQRRNAQRVSAPLAKWQQDLEQLKEKPPTETPKPRKRNRSNQRKRNASYSTGLHTRFGANPKPSEVKTYKMSEATQQAMSDAGLQMTEQERRAIKDKVTRTDWANLVRSESALERQILDYLASSPLERAVIDYELQQIINRKNRQGNREHAYWVIAIRKQMKARLR